MCKWPDEFQDTVETAIMSEKFIRFLSSGNQVKKPAIGKSK